MPRRRDSKRVCYTGAYRDVCFTATEHVQTQTSLLFVVCRSFEPGLQTILPIEALLVRGFIKRERIDVKCFIVRTRFLRSLANRSVRWIKKCPATNQYKTDYQTRLAPGADVDTCGSEHANNFLGSFAYFVPLVHSKQSRSNCTLAKGASRSCSSKDNFVGTLRVSFIPEYCSFSYLFAVHVIKHVTQQERVDSRNSLSNVVTHNLNRSATRVK